VFGIDVCYRDIPGEVMKKIIATDKAPKAIGPYSQANVIDCRQLVFVSGQVPIDPAVGKIVAQEIVGQSHQVIKNVKSILEAAGSSLDKVVRITVYLQSLEDFKAMNEIYTAYFKENFPARSTFQVARLPLDALIEIDAIGYV
jgi:2-iminobutanoate/2-iminopropanoate deaminase